MCTTFQMWGWPFTIWSKTVNTKVTTNDRCWSIFTTATDWMSRGQLIACMKQTDRDRMNAWRERKKELTKSRVINYSSNVFRTNAKFGCPMCKCVTRWFVSDFIFRIYCCHIAFHCMYPITYVFNPTNRNQRAKAK